MARAPLPERDWDLTKPFWDEAEKESLVIQRCQACERFVWFPAAKCPRCGGEALKWTRVSGRGRLFSWALVEKPLFGPYREKVPYLTGLVSLEEDEGVRVVTLLVDCEPEDLEIEMPMQVVFRSLSFESSSESVMAPFFRPISDTK